MTYSNVDTQKVKIFKVNKSKYNIYRLNNTITGKKYIGSFRNLASIFSYYHSIIYLENREKKKTLALFIIIYYNMVIQNLV